MTVTLGSPQPLGQSWVHSCEPPPRKHGDFSSWLVLPQALLSLLCDSPSLALPPTQEPGPRPRPGSILDVLTRSWELGQCKRWAWLAWINFCLHKQRSAKATQGCFGLPESPTTRLPESLPRGRLYRDRLGFELEQLIFVGSLLTCPLQAMGIRRLRGRGGERPSHQGSLRFKHRGDNPGPAFCRDHQHLAVSAGGLLGSPDLASYLSDVGNRISSALKKISPDSPRPSAALGKWSVFRDPRALSCWHVPVSPRGDLGRRS